jgi:hypothetical protein
MALLPLQRHSPRTERSMCIPSGKPDERCKTSTPPLWFLPLQRLASSRQQHSWKEDATLQSACTSRFSQPPGAFIRREPAGPVSCRLRSWGSFPPEPCSSRAAVRRLRRLYPHVVHYDHTDCSRPEIHRPTPRPRGPEHQTPHQGRQPAQSRLDLKVLLHTRIRLEHRRFRPSLTRSSPGFQSPPGSSPSPRWPGFHQSLPSRGWHRYARRNTNYPTTGCHSRRGRLVSRETAYPPGVSYLMTPTFVRLCRGPGITSSVAEVRSRPLARHLWTIFRAYRSRLCAACR